MSIINILFQGKEACYSWVLVVTELDVSGTQCSCVCQSRSSSV